MELNLLKLLRGTDYPVEGCEKYDFSARDFGHFTVPSPVCLCYKAEHETGGAQLWIDLTATITAECARCLSSFEREWHVEKTYHIAKRDMDEEFPEFPFTPAGGLDLEELAYGELVLEVEPILLCDEDCRGLCPKCGCKPDDCTCSADTPAEEGDPRLQALRDLLTD